MTKKVIIATKNPGKAAEFSEMFAKFDIQVETLLDHAEIADIAETGSSFMENAGIKASETAKLLGQIVIADDSGLCIDALEGRPGLYSARYAGPEKDDQANRTKVLTEMKAVADEDRTAHFFTALVVANASGEIIARYSGRLDGLILREEQGQNGFGYDPIFYVKEKGMTTAEMTSDEKAAISHRGQALAALQADLDGGRLVL
ncbi:non-canonical purine NTP pyrophosphatase [Aerococcus urinaehominis]|uniref:dITP/XTP pyrophosphatase n=1 Tax=Aerococcus urinaehominis TaxID=128944 RepID=A0A120IAR5_9LACT|nr:XTP/dITP diphosphatase [Aerococcus urinaehominis]AMB98890.1 non-canonical purine NTP pyrophosphatase [Aerococcus urinaehominis]SDM15777.1 XTP/dITP diphosphohydrolase [Aerococcus urinaehominis]